VVPLRLLTKRIETLSGLKYASDNGGLVFQSDHVAKETQPFAQIFELLTTASDQRHIAYSNYTSQRFIVSGTDAGRFFYTLYYSAPADSIGFTVTWDDSFRQSGTIISTFVASYALPLAALSPPNQAGNTPGQPTQDMPATF